MENARRLTVAQISEILTADEISENVLAMLKSDSRISVMRLIHQWQQRKLAVRKEFARVMNLYHYERLLRARGLNLVAGVDEAGRGPLAGPVVIGAVILPLNGHIPSLNDSKKLTPKRREELYYRIKERALAVSVSVIGVEEIDSDNIYQATIHGMYQALAGLSPAPDAALIDAVPLPQLTIYSQSLVGGDAISASIAAASIIAKVERDKIMDELDALYPVYGFSRHKGYGTREHFQAIQAYGPCPIHRCSFEPIKSWGNKDHEYR
jgi:ribonuclease HII